MPTKKTTSSTKASSKSKTSATRKKTVKAKKQTPKKTTKKVASKKTTTAKKTTVKKKTTATKKKGVAKKTTRKKTTASRKARDLQSEQQLHVFPKKRTLINQLPVIDLDQLSTKSMHSPTESKVVEKVAIHSRLAFYLGIFMGAIVVNAFLVTVLAVLSV